MSSHSLWHASKRLRFLALLSLTLALVAEVRVGDVVANGNDLSKAHAYISCRNTSTTAQTFAVQANWPSGPISLEQELVTLDPGKTAIIAATIGDGNIRSIWDLKPIAFSIRIDDGDPIVIQRRIQAHHAIESAFLAPAVDGDLQDWGELPIIIQKPAFGFGQDVWQGLNDSWFRFGIRHHAGDVYIAIEVFDDEPHAIGNKFPWEQDGIEVRVDPRPQPLAANARLREESDFTIIATSPVDKGNENVLYKPAQIPEGTQALCVFTKDGYRAEIKVPRAYLQAAQEHNEAWQNLRINVAIDDHDPSNADDASGAQIWWQPDWRKDNNPLKGIAVRMPEPMP